MRYGITGIARSGKNVVADVLKLHFPHLPVIALADPIKEVFCKTFGWDERHRDGEFKERRFNTLYLDKEILATHTAYRYGVLKQVAMRAVNLLGENLAKIEGVEVLHQDNELVLKNVSPRMLYQIWGSDVWREIDPDGFWIKLLPKDCIVPDVRFDDEAKAMHKVIHVKRPNTAAVARAHYSEDGISAKLVDHLIINDSSLEDLEDKVASIALSLKFNI